MGQFFNQPDFGTEAFPVTIGTTNVNQCALYMGVGGNIEVKLVGSRQTAVVFKNIPNGSFLPCIVSEIVAGANTTVSEVIAIK
jgi:hypothetical protein|tara:strand:+ start:222 stop:470 length:249 start_codon:yes stop_codon:yes gene_type:complete